MCHSLGCDVAILLDSSTSIEGDANFQLALAFVVAVFEAIGVSAQMRVAFIIFGSTTQVVFNFEKYTAFADVRTAVMGAKLVGGTCTAGAALTTCRSDVFASARSSRILVVMFAGRSTDSVMAPSSAIKEIGVKVIGVAMGGGYDQEQMDIMVSSQDYILKAASYSALSGLSGQCVELIRRGKLLRTDITYHLHEFGRWRSSVVL